MELVSYGPDDPFAYGYNDACTAFANGESAMYPIGSYAVPQILSVNPDMNIDSFVTPGNDDASKNTLNSGVDLMFAVTAACENKDAAYEVLVSCWRMRTSRLISTTRTLFHVKKEILTWRRCLTV